jgi:hypothetical protein
MKAFAAIAVATGLAFSGGAAQAATYIVDAQANSSTAGVGLDTLNLTTGQMFKVLVDAGDLWNAGSLPRWSNANGLAADLFATGSDDSGESAGTKIGQDFGLHSQNGFSAPYGALVGLIGTEYRILGTNFSGQAWGTGTLQVYYWDSNNFDNTEFITADISAVPEPAVWSMLIVGFLGAGAMLRNRRRQFAPTTA